MKKNQIQKKLNELTREAYRSIDFTTDYDKFHYHPANRTINKRQVEILSNIFGKESIQTPILVTQNADMIGHFYIVDGQHRFQALKSEAKNNPSSTIEVNYVDVTKIMNMMGNDTFFQIVNNFNIGQHGFNKRQILERVPTSISQLVEEVTKGDVCKKRLKSTIKSEEFSKVFTVDFVEHVLGITSFKKTKYTEDPGLTKEEVSKIKFLAKLTKQVIDAFDGYRWSHSNTFRKSLSRVLDNDTIVRKPDPNNRLFTDFNKKLREMIESQEEELNYDTRSTFYKNMYEENWLEKIFTDMIYEQVEFV